jgi:hypothetical protein
VLFDVLFYGPPHISMGLRSGELVGHSCKGNSSLSFTLDIESLVSRSMIALTWCGVSYSWRGVLHFCFGVEGIGCGGGFMVEFVRRWLPCTGVDLHFCPQPRTYVLDPQKAINSIS